MTSLSFCACPPSLWEKNYSDVGHSLKISNDLKPDLWRYRGGPVRRWSGNGSWLEATFPTRPNGGYRASGAPQPTKVVHYDKVNFPKKANLCTREKCNIFRLCLQNILAGHFDNGGNRAELTKVVHYDYKEANLSTRFSNLVQEEMQCLPLVFENILSSHFKNKYCRTCCQLWGVWCKSIDRVARIFEIRYALQVQYYREYLRFDIVDIVAQLNNLCKDFLKPRLQGNILQ